MPGTRLDVLAIGDAVVDVIADAEEGFLVEERLVKGSMQLLDAGQATRLYEKMGPARETSGGSAANTVSGIAAMGGRAGFVGQVAKDQLGEVFTHDIRAHGVEFETPPIDGGLPTGRCLILVTPDAQRTMNTFPGAAHQLSAQALDEEQIRGAAILYLEAYLWRAEGPREAMRAAIRIARAAGRKVALTLSDIACIGRHRADFLGLIEGGEIDMLFANEAELRSLAEEEDFDSALGRFEGKVPVIVVTCSEKGAIALEGGRRVEVPAAPVAKVVDTTGAGDLFAAGVLAALARGRSIEDSLRTGAIAAAEVISHYGARPEADLKALVRL
ncbi:adenosine kinase [Allosphingosinicella sp.]|jgi:sugar/nucleoside kinase (ribokinase family)|uniref:adenosine kinase n=1 Tax=Allosphingosinicella sp. TaxID=2823234 RepID=UPI002EDE9C42